jgi:NAD(P)-dependent dehydrogenase (short-subunit alcohol dehydrogenase family)
VIVGGTKGVGRELAALWAGQGQTVTAVGRQAGQAPEGVNVVTGDAERPEELLRSLRDVILERGPLCSLVFLQRYRGSEDTWSGELNVSLTATRVVLEGLAEEFAPDGDRSVALVGSNAGRFVTTDQGPGYHVAKAALAQLGRYYAVKLGPLGIRVNVVSPCAFVKQESAAYYEGRDDLTAMYEAITPLGRMGTAAEVARVVALMCGPGMSFVTGQELYVDGGLSLVQQDGLARKLATRHD